MLGLVVPEANPFMSFGDALGASLEHQAGALGLCEMLPVLGDHAKRMGGINRMDRHESDCSSTVRTTCFCLRIFFWTFDDEILACHLVVVAPADICPERKQHRTWSGGRWKFQIHLVELMEFAVQLEWEEPFEDGSKPG
jgi:hypothetical protein